MTMMTSSLCMWSTPPPAAALCPSIILLQATVILHFADKDEWTLSDLSDASGLSEKVLAQKLKFWVQNGIVVKTTNSSGTVYVGAKAFSEGVVAVRMMLALDMIGRQAAKLWRHDDVHPHKISHQLPALAALLTGSGRGQRRSGELASNCGAVRRGGNEPLRAVRLGACVF